MMRHNRDQAHEFALYYAPLNQTSLTPSTPIILNDPQLVHRMHTVLRLTPESTCILFNTTHHAHVRIETHTKKQITCAIISVQENRILTPSITVFLPLLKREAFHEALYACTELGATTIQLISTQKSQTATKMGTLEHVGKVIIAAAEQSKNFHVPRLVGPRSLEEAIGEHSTTYNVIFDPTGTSFFNYLCSEYKRNSSISILIGPEGDLTAQEKEVVKNHSFVPCSLTPTVLRAQQALVIGLGMLRSL